MAIRDEDHRFERLSVAVDQHNRTVFVWWMDRVTSGTLTLTAAEAIAIGDQGQMLQAYIDTLPPAEADAAAKLAKARDLITQLRDCAAESKYALAEGAYKDAADWLDEAIGGDPS
jgi:hypothetical protein